MYQLTQINIYPIKSLGRITLTSAFAGEKGLQYDRRWMLVDANNRFITQRENHLMATIGVAMDESGFKLFDKNNPLKKYSLPFAVHSGQRSRVVIWNDECDAFLFEDAINKWLQETLNMDCRLVYMPDDSSRYVDNKYARQNETVSFADGYPVLIIGETSLQDLNNKLDVPVPMNRFRPNFVFSGGNAFEEDSWNEIKIGEAIFNGVKLCGRCVITTIDQDSGHASKEPLRTLSQYRKVENSVYFGQNLVVSTPGTVKLNDEIVLSSATIK